MVCPFLSAKHPVGHSKAEELLTLAILGVNSKIVKSKKKKIYLRFVEVSVFYSPLQKKTYENLLNDYVFVKKIAFDWCPTNPQREQFNVSE